MQNRATISTPAGSFSGDFNKKRTGWYCFEFNGQEKDDEVFGSTGTSYTAQFWQYDSRTGRRWNVDPVVKPWESSYATFANNPIWFIDPSGADTSFVNSNGDYDKQAQKDFTTAYSNVKTRIANLNKEISGYEKQLNSGELNKRQTRRVNKAKSKAENTLTNWNKLKTDFDEIIDSKVVFNYSSDISLINKNENGAVLPTSKIFRDNNGGITGNINIVIRPSHDESVIHENRHGNQILSGKYKTMTVLQKERDAFIYQRIYNYSSVHNLIEKARIQKYGVEGASMRPEWTLDDMINYLYQDEIRK